MLAALATVVLVTAWFAGHQSAPSGDGSTDATRLGPSAGEPVAAYLARIRHPPPGPGPRLALVQYAKPVDAGSAVDAVRAIGAAPVQAVFRVPFPRVQTAVRRLPLMTAAPLPGVLAAETQAAVAARAQQRAATGRVAAVAGAEATALGGHCACVLALVVRLPAVDPDRPPGPVPPIRAIEVAPAGARDQALAVSPLLPEQTGVVGPVPDDGPVPDGVR